MICERCGALAWAWPWSCSPRLAWWDSRSSGSERFQARFACPRICTSRDSVIKGTIDNVDWGFFFNEPALSSVGNPDTYVSTRYGSGSGSFYHQAKMVRKTFIPPVLGLLYDFLSLKNDVNVLASKVINKKKLIFSCHLEGHWQK